MRYYVSTFKAQYSSLILNICTVMTDYTQFFTNLYFDFELLLNSFLFQFFRKFLYADYAWFLFSSSTTQMFKRYL